MNKTEYEQEFRRARERRVNRAFGLGIVLVLALLIAASLGMTALFRIIIGV